MSSRDRLKSLLPLAFLLYSASTIAWIRADRTPPSWDPSDHLSTALQYFRAARLGLDAFLSEFIYGQHVYAPLYHLAVTGALALLPKPEEAAGLVNLVTLATIMFSTLGVGRRLYGEREGLWAAVIVPAYPILAWLVHDAFLDLMLVAAVTTSLYALIRADRFQSRTWSLILGFSLGLGWLVKQTFPFFLWLPLMIEAYRGVRVRDRSRLLNLAVCLGAAAALASLWYLPHGQDTWAIFQANRGAAVEQGHPFPLSPLSIMAYPYFLANYQQQFPFFALFLFGLVHAWMNRREESRLLFLVLLGTYFAFTLLANKNPRYTAPILPAAAILSVSWLGARTLLPRKRLWSMAILLWCGFSFFQTQWPPPSGEGFYFGSRDRKGLRLIIAGHNLLHFDHRPGESGWPVSQIFDDIRAERPHRPVTIGVTSNAPFFNPSSFRYFAELSSTRAPSDMTARIDYLLDHQGLERLNVCDFVVTRYRSETGGDRTDSEAEIRDRPEWLNGFDLWRSYAVIDGTEALVYRRKW